MIDDIIAKLKNKSSRNEFISPDLIKSLSSQITNDFTITIYDQNKESRITITKEKVVVYIYKSEFFEELDTSENGLTPDEIFNLTTLTNISQYSSVQNVKRIRSIFDEIQPGFYILYDY